MSRPRVPLSTFERDLVHSAFRWSGALVALGLAAAGLAAAVGDARLAFWVAVASVAYGVSLLLLPLRIPWLVALMHGVVPLAVGFALGYPLIGALAGVALFAWEAVAGSRLHLDPGSVQPLEAVEVDPEAAGHVADFEALGFEPVGALSFAPAPERRVVETLMLGPRGDQYAAVTDIILNVTSRFGSRVLVTRNSALATLLPEVLGNDLRGADARELVDAHRRALEVLAARGLRPDPIDRDGLVQWQVRFERRSIELIQARRRSRLAPFVRSGTGAGPLDDGAESARRIDAWLET